MISFNTQINNINFKSYKHTVSDKFGGILYRGDTCFFRHDLDFDKFADFLNLKYANTDKVNVIVQACSDGEEAYSLLAVMMDRLGKHVSKFLPIKAGDIDEEHIQIAKKGNYFIESYEKKYLDFYLEDRYKSYFDINDYNFIFKSFNVKDLLKNQVKFKKADILSDAKKINMTNTVLVARNFWPYLKKDDVVNLIQILRKKFDKTSTLVIGDYDKQLGIDDLLKNYGFVESSYVNNVFEYMKEPHEKFNFGIFRKLFNFCN